MASAETTVHPTDEPDDSPFVRSVLGWIALMIVLIGGISFAGITAATGSWTDGAIVAGFLATFIAPALGGLFAGVLWADRQERESSAAPHRGPVRHPGHRRHRHRGPACLRAGGLSHRDSPTPQPRPVGSGPPAGPDGRDADSPPPVSSARSGRAGAGPTEEGAAMRIPEQGLGEDELFEVMGTYRDHDLDTKGGRTWAYVYDPGRRRRRPGGQARPAGVLRRERARPHRVPQRCCGSRTRSSGMARAPPPRRAGRGRQLHHRRHRVDHDGGQGGPGPGPRAPARPGPTDDGAAGHRARRVPQGGALLRRRRGVGARSTPTTWKADVGAMADARGRPHDPAGRLGGVLRARGGRPDPRARALALERDVLLHVDGCIGGFVLPYFRRLGRDGDRLRLRRARRDVDLDGLPQVRVLPEGRVGRALPRRLAAAPPALRQGGVDRVHGHQHDLPEHQVGRRRWPPPGRCSTTSATTGYLDIADRTLAAVDAIVAGDRRHGRPRRDGPTPSRT